jgi:rhodanese-related sulfurtransferase
MLPKLETAPEDLQFWIGHPNAPAIIDVRTDEDFAEDRRLVPASVRRDWRTVTHWATEWTDRKVVVVCQRGAKLSQGVAAHLRLAGADATPLSDGFVGWRRAGGLTIDATRLPPRDEAGRTLWVTRQRPKIDRIACPWLIRRFIDPQAAFLFVAPADVKDVAERFAATPFDIEDVAFSHRGDTCTFDTMLTDFGLDSDALTYLSHIVRGADTARLELAPEAAGLLAMALGASRLHEDDLQQLEAGLGIYDALYLWCRDGRGETHNWPVVRATEAHA